MVIFIFIICLVISKLFGFSSFGSSFKIAGTGCSVDNNRAHLYPCGWEIYKILFIGIILTTRQYHKYFQNAILYVGYTCTYEGAIEQILRGISSSDWYITGDYVKLNVKTQTILTNICFQNIYFIVTTTKHCGNKN